MKSVPSTGRLRPSPHWLDRRAGQTAKGEAAAGDTATQMGMSTNQTSGTETAASGNDTSLLRFVRHVQVRHEAPSQFEDLRRRLLQRSLLPLDGMADVESVRQAANEAASLAWLTDHPLLLFPILFEERSASALARRRRQAGVYARSRTMLQNETELHLR